MTRLLTADQAAALLDVPAQTIRRWARTGQAAPAGLLRAPVPGGAQQLYRLAELQPLAEKYHHRATQKRNTSHTS